MRLPSLSAALLGTLVATMALGVTGSRTARADEVSDVLGNYELEAKALATDLPRPNQNPTPPQRRLVDAQVAYATGDYDASALVLLDLVGTLQGPDAEVATYYLAEALYHKGDRGTASTYFQTLAKSSMGKYYQVALERLVEIAIDQHDMTSGDEWRRQLESVSQPQPSVPYVLGKYAFAQGKYDDAVAKFGAVAKGSDSELQALYYTGTTAVAKKDLARAIEVFGDLIGRRPGTSIDRRVIELGQLALGRLYYEREQPSKSIDSYLLIDRRSDLFPDALYEVAWVYVKSKQYDKALRALELLEQSDPNTTKQPTVRILEGNLRIRKAQLIRASQIDGTINKADEQTDPAVEYDKATKLFASTHDQFMPAYVALSQMVNGNLDPTVFVEQVAGRSNHVFQITASIPEAAAQWLRDEPGVQQFVGVESDLGDIQANLMASEAIIARLEGVLAAGDRTRVYPQLAARRARLATIEDDLNKIRNTLADRQLSLIDSSGELAQLSANRKQLAQQFAALGNPERAYGDRVADAQKSFDKADDDLTQIEGVIASAQAIAVTLRKYAADSPNALVPTQKAAMMAELDAAAKEAQAIEDELAALHKEAVLGKDLAGFSDDQIANARELRKKLDAALAAEQRLLTGFAASSRDRSRSQTLAAEGDRATKLYAQLDALDNQIDGLVGQGLAEVKAQLVVEHKNLDAYKQELAEHEAESRDVGGTVLGASFKDVQSKFYDVIVRTDVGVVDVSWSQKEQDDDDLKRLNLARSRELKQLKDEFKDILDQGAPKPSAPKKADIAPPQPTEGATSPDKTGKPADRVAPVGDRTPTSTQPAVKPDETAPGTTPKAGATPKPGATPKKGAAPTPNGGAKGGSQ